MLLNKYNFLISMTVISVPLIKFTKHIMKVLKSVNVLSMALLYLTLVILARDAISFNTF